MGYVEDLRAVIDHRPVILAGSLVIIVDPKGRILLQQRKCPEGFWGIPGGLMELGETTMETARRELFEEAHLEISNLELFGVYTKTELTHLDNDDEYMGVNVVYTTHDYQGELVVDEKESLRFAWFDPTEIPENTVDLFKTILDDYVKKVVSSDENKN